MLPSAASVMATVALRDWAHDNSDEIEAGWDVTLALVPLYVSVFNGTRVVIERCSLDQTAIIKVGWPDCRIRNTRPPCHTARGSETPLNSACLSEGDY